MPSPPLESHSGRFDGEFRGRRKRERERERGKERGNERWDKGRDEPRNRDETNDNLSLKTLRAKSYGLVSPELYSPEFFPRFAPRGTVTRERYRHPRISYQHGGRERWKIRLVESLSKIVDESSQKLLRGRGLVPGFDQVLWDKF